MSPTEGVFLVPEMSSDPRIHVFRRTLGMLEGLEGMEVDAYVVLTERYVAILDTMLCPEDAGVMLQAVQSELATRPLLVVNSHADWDHAWGNSYFRAGTNHAAPIIAQKHGMIRLQSEEAHTELAEFQKLSDLFRNVVLTPAVSTFDMSLTLFGGDLTLELLTAPGHYADHIAAWIPELRLLLAFDAIEKPLPCLENALSVPAQFATLERFLALQPERVLCSHGKTTSPTLISENLAYLREIEQRCRRLQLPQLPSEEEMQDASTLIGYPFDEVIAGIPKSEVIDRTFYSEAHNDNVRFILEWVLSHR